MGQLPQELWSNLLELLLQQKAELLQEGCLVQAVENHSSVASRAQDPVAAHNVLQKVLGLKGGLPKASREQAKEKGRKQRKLGRAVVFLGSWARLPDSGSSAWRDWCGCPLKASEATLSSAL